MAGPYPSYEELWANSRNSKIFNDAFKRVYWPLDGSFPDSFRVMKTARGAHDEMEPFRHADGAWHEIALLPLTEPKISSIDVTLPMLDEYEGQWVNQHQELCQDGEYIPLEEREEVGDDVWGEDSESEFLVRCCGEDRPRDKRDQKVTVLPSDGRDFVTVHDYLSTVHAWLKSLRDDIAGAMCVSDVFAVGVVEHSYEEEWMISSTFMTELCIDEKRMWQQSHEPPRPPSASSLRIMEMSRQRRAKAMEILQEQDEARTEEEKREDEKMTPEEREERTMQRRRAIEWTLH